MLPNNAQTVLVHKDSSWCPRAAAFVASLWWTAPAGPVWEASSPPCCNRRNAGCQPGLWWSAVLTVNTCFSCCSFPFYIPGPDGLQSLQPTDVWCSLWCTPAPLEPAGLCLQAEGKQVWLQSLLRLWLVTLMASSLLDSLQHCLHPVTSPCLNCDRAVPPPWAYSQRAGACCLCVVTHLLLSQGVREARNLLLEELNGVAHAD